MEGLRDSAPQVNDDEENPELCDKEKLILRTFVQEYKLFEALVDDIVKNNGVIELAAVKRAQSILDKYQEQGQLLEPHLESLVLPLMNIVSKKAVELRPESEKLLAIVKPIAIFINTLVAVCGYKTVARFFPHQVSDLEPAVMLLEKCHAETGVSSSIREESTGEWETKCVMLLWLSILVLIPFDMSSIDSALDGTVSEECASPLVERVISICKDYLSNPGPMRKMAGVLLSRLLTRPDMKSILRRFMEWTEASLEASPDGPSHDFLVHGITEALAAIFKVGGRDTLVDVVSIAWREASILIKSNHAAHSPLLRKLLIKLTQRIGLTYLPQRSFLWHYVGRSSSLKENLSSEVPTTKCDNGLVQQIQFAGILNKEEMQDEEIDVPDVIEEVIEELLAGLRDKDTVVRWSAAKGIGRVTSRLTAALADEVVGSIFELFSPSEGEGSWHGGCLALAELSRRGLLLPDRLPEVVPVLIKALHYDVRKGPHSVGSNVRDAAAYVCWAFGRAYSHLVMKSILDEIAPHLLAIACYDREVNCRRAAAAAFQENVGRQGTFPHGIDIINAADYFSLASRSNAYLNVAAYIAHFNNYLSYFVEELLERKICHWEKGLRELAAVSLAALVKYDTSYFGDMVLDKLTPRTLSSDLNIRHGATLAVAEVVLALHKTGYIFSSEKQRTLGGIVPAIEKSRLYRGKGGEIMRASVSRLIECMSLAHITLTSKVQRSLLETINENLRHPNAQIQIYAKEALRHLVQSYFDKADTTFSSQLISRYVQMLRSDPNVAAKRGSALALSVLPYQFLIQDWKPILTCLSAACLVPENPDERDAETRVNAVRALISVCQTLTGIGIRPEPSVSLRKEPLLGFIKSNVVPSLFGALGDYSVDNRGDVGSWVREAAMEALEQCSYILCQGLFLSGKHEMEIVQVPLMSRVSIDCIQEENDAFDEDLAEKLIANVAKQAVEKIDKLREVAGKALQRLIHNESIAVPFVPHKGNLERIVPKDPSINWAVPSVSFPYLVNLLQFTEYCATVLSGLVISIGGLAESLSKASLNALLGFLHAPHDESNFNKSRVKLLSFALNEVLCRHKKIDRVIVPCLKTVELLFDKGVFSHLEDRKEAFSMALLECLAIELKGSKDVRKLLTGINVLEHICALQKSSCSQALSLLFSFLGHPYPKVRKACADQVYFLLIQNGDQLLGADVLNDTLEIISETCWDGPREEPVLQMQKIYRTFGLKVPLLNSFSLKPGQHPKTSKSDKFDENESYSSLVDSSGF